MLLLDLIEFHVAYSKIVKSKILKVIFVIMVPFLYLKGLFYFLPCYFFAAVKNVKKLIRIQ